MNIKSEDEMKVEELNSEYDFSEQSFQICPNGERNFALPDNIKNEELDQVSSIKSEMREPNFEFEFLEEVVNNEMIKSENTMMIAEKSSGKQICPNSERNFSLPDNIKNEELDQVSSIKSEMREPNFEFVFVEEFVNNEMIKSDNPMMIAEKSIGKQKFLSLRSVSSLLRKINEKGSEVYFESDEEEFFAQLVSSKFPLVLLRKWSDEEIKILLDGGCEKENGSSCRVCAMLTHEEKEFFSCSDCSYTRSRKGYLQSHLLTHKHRKLFKCSLCTYKCNRKIDLDSHVSEHRYVKSFKFSGSNNNNKKKRILKSQEKLFKCSECNYESNYELHFRKHILYHENVKLYKCSECNFETNYKGNLVSHEQLRHKKLIFKCSESINKSDDRTNLTKFHKFRYSNTIFKCPKCSYETNLKTMLNKHMAWHDKKEKLVIGNSYAFVKKKLGLSGQKN